MLPRLFRLLYVLVTAGITIYLYQEGKDYYALPLEERFYHDHHHWFKASGLMGHGLGIVGTLLIVIGVVLYIVAKKYGWFTGIARLKYILEFHIFLCTLGPIMVMFHTTYKFGGIVSIAFWSMVIVVLSGVVGRFLYIRLPRDWQGRELTYGDAEAKLKKLELVESPNNVEKAELNTLRMQLRSMKRNQEFFKYWHIAHRPFALIMLVIVAVHIAATLILGYGFWR